MQIIGQNQNLRSLFLGVIWGFAISFGIMNILWSSRLCKPTLTLMETLSKNQWGEIKDEFREETKTTIPEPVRVLCWVMTSPNNSHKATIVKQTWGRRCDKLLFMSSENSTKFPAVALPNVSEGRSFLWAKTKESFKYVYENHLNDADWFIKADDDTFIVVENLKKFLQDFDSNLKLYFGSKFKLFTPNGYMSGGAGYVISKAALKTFVEDGINNVTICRQDHDGAEDVEFGKCMYNLNCTAGDSRDNLGRSRFMPFPPDVYLTPGSIDAAFPWYKSYAAYPESAVKPPVSPSAISFHYVQPHVMRVLDFLVYHLKVDGEDNCKE